MNSYLLYSININYFSGSIDGKHVVIIPPANSGSNYYNYKGTHSIVLLGVCDAHYRFIYVDVGANGRISDGGVWNRCRLRQLLDNGSLSIPDKRPLPNSLIQTPFVFVGDDAFPIKPYLMKPFPLRHLETDKIEYNYRLSRCRRTIENSFGILVKVFKIFEKPLNVQPVEKCSEIVMTCVVLHNFLRTYKISPNQRSTSNDGFVGGDGMFDYNEAADETLDVHGLEVQIRYKIFFSREGKKMKKK